MKKIMFLCIFTSVLMANIFGNNKSIYECDSKDVSLSVLGLLQRENPTLFKKYNMKGDLVEIKVLDINKDINYYKCNGNFELYYKDIIFYTNFDYETREIKKSKKPLQVTVYDFKRSSRNLFTEIEKYFEKEKEITYAKKIGFEDFKDYENYKKYKKIKTYINENSDLIIKLNKNILDRKNLKRFILKDFKEFKFQKNKYLKATNFKRDKEKINIKIKNLHKYSVYNAFLNLIVLDKNLDPLTTLEVGASYFNNSKNIKINLPSNLKNNKELKFHLVLEKIVTEHPTKGSEGSGKDIRELNAKLIKKYKLLDTKTLENDKKKVNDFMNLVKSTSKHEKKYQHNESLEKILF